MRTPVVGIDARMWRHSGIGTYLRNMVRAFSSVSPRPRIVLYGDQQLLQSVNGQYEIRDLRSKIYSIREQWALFFRSRSVALWHSPHYNAPFFAGKKLVVTVHDLIPFLFRRKFYNWKQVSYFETMIRRIRKKADCLIAVSESTKADLVRDFGFDPRRIHVIYEAVDSAFHEPLPKVRQDEIRSRFELPDRFVLYVGLIKPHKNVDSLIRVVRRLRKRDKTYPKLVLIGKKDHSYPKGFEALSQIQTDQDILYAGEVDDELIPGFYQMATCFVLPSLYEGFGLTVLEAFSSDCPVICSNRGSLPEVAGEGALLFDPTSEDSLEMCLSQVVNDTRTQGNLKEKGRRQLEKFSWEKTARETIGVYEELLKED